MRPVLHAVAGIALLSVMDALIKGAVESLPVLQVALLRYLVGSAAILALAAWRRPGWPTREALLANGVRAILVVITATSFFYALGRLPLAETLILSFVSPAFTVLFAAILLGERVGPRILVSLVAGFAGVAVIVAGGLGGEGARETSLSGVAAVLVSAVGYSATNVLLRARAQRDPLLVIVAIQNLVPAAILAGPGWWVWRMPEGSGWLLLGAIGLLGVAGHLVLARAYAAAEAARLAALEYTALIWAVLFGFLAFGEVPGGFAWAGGALILGSAWIVARR
ncbi:DMT family transporter [Enterovirga sp.]|uniref:DMT family transporter n=1 Tax=Enterovirga sp. TaxID=2026350 RepID=UPI002CEA7671|nr:DMT family transporter [Enterovirga sp.]HMO31169.1 DMT family transporter [Enterovirga sp.]